MKILFTGQYNPTDSRVRVLSTGLRAINASVIESPYLSRKEFDPTGFHQKSNLFDLVYLPPGAASDLIFISKKIAAPVLLDSRSYFGKENSFFVNQKSKGSGSGLSFLIRKNLRAADHILADSGSAAEELIRRYGAKEENITVIPHGTIVTQFFPSLKNTGKGEKVIGMILRDGGKKELSRVFDAISSLDSGYHLEIDLRVATGELLEMAENLSSKYNSNIKVSPVPEWDRLPALINNFDICLGQFSSVKGSEYTVNGDLFNYLACGKAVVTMRNEATSSLFTNGIHLSFCDPDMSSIASAIEKVLSDNEYRKTLASEGLRMIREKYNEEIVAGEFAALVSKLMR